MFCYRSFGKLLAQDRQPISKTAPPKANRWWAVRDSNPQPTGCRPVALTNWANRPKDNTQERHNTYLCKPFVLQYQLYNQVNWNSKNLLQKHKPCPHTNPSAKFRVISHRNMIISSGIWSIKQNLSESDYHAHWAINRPIFYNSVNIKYIDS